MITETSIRYEFLKEDRSRLGAAHYAHSSFYLENHTDGNCYWRTELGETVAEKFKPEDAKRVLIAYLNRNFVA
jgi:hypothetical protein